jgi:stage II sporulation protein D
VPEEDERAYVYNYVPLEEYVQCVLASEAYPEWNHQALAAQAVAIRSYSLHNLGRHQEYDLCDQTHCQKYLGISDHPAFAAAVTETQGEVLTWAGRVINAVYHSSSGGYTKNNEDVWGGDPLPYLRGVTDFDQRGENYRWKQTPFYTVTKFGEEIQLESSAGLVIAPRFNGEGILNGFVCRQKAGRSRREFSNEELRRIFALPSGNFQLHYLRAEDLTKALQADRLVDLGTAEIEGDYVTFRAELDLKVRSRRIHEPVTLSADEYLLFIGNGAGHGVGLSQWGAQAMGEQGHTYQAILRYFYGELPQLIRLD